ncbi:MAG TPA: MFS transporter [Micromonosporaceae bacterium]
MAATPPPASVSSSPPPVRRQTTFASLRIRNYRIYAFGQLVSNTGAWVQRIAQDWLVLSITGSATAVGLTTALQFLPTLLFGLFGGVLADRYPKRRLLLATQLGIASTASVLACLTLTDRVQAWHVYVVAFVLGCVTAVDNPTRQSFVNEMVGPEQLRNAISINSSVFQSAALVGPAISGALIEAVGSGYAFAINAVSYLAPIVALIMIRPDQLNTLPKAATTGRLSDGIRYVVRRPHMLWPTVLVGVFGMFTTNLPVTLAAYAKTAFHAGAGGYGLLSSTVAVGSLIGALISARRPRTRLRGLVTICFALAALEILASLAPNQWIFRLFLSAVGATTLLLLISANSMVQLAAPDGIRGRVMGVYLLVFIGSGALGGPLVGGIDQHLGPRFGMFLAGAVPALTAAVVAVKLARDLRLRVRLRLHGPLRRLVAVVPE